MLLGCIADDLTGATDLALMLVRGGMRTVQVMDVPAPGSGLEAYDAVVVALKTRTCPVGEAVDVSLRAADALLALGARQLLFKYCSTFDSTDEGNIGPVGAALLDKLGDHVAIVCPAFPLNKRTIYLGNLFVGDQPLAESPMKDHPLTPMRDSNLVRVLQRQTRHRVGLVPFSAVDQGAAAVRQAYAAARAAGERFVVVDAVADRHLIAMGEAAADHKLITGGSGVAMGLPGNFVRQGLLKPAKPTERMAAPAGRAAVLAGSCSVATRGQIAAATAAGMPAFRLDPLQIAAGKLGKDEAMRWVARQAADKPVLIYASDDPDAVRQVQEKLGRHEAGALIEREMSTIAQQLVAAGFTRMIVAGGETSGAVVNGLGVGALEIGPEIDPGVPWCRAVGCDLVLALKSGNFGAPDFFLKAWERLA